MKCEKCKEENIFKKKLCAEPDCPSKAPPVLKDTQPEPTPGTKANSWVKKKMKKFLDDYDRQMEDLIMGGSRQDTPLELYEEWAGEDSEPTTLMSTDFSEEAQELNQVRTIKLPNGRVITLNPQQCEALDKMMEWLIDRNSLFFTLSGWAGTGKTSITKEAIKQFFNRGNGSVVVSAPTHKAKKVVSNATNLEGETIQSLLGLAPNVELADFDINKPEFSPKKEPTIEYYKLVVVDEASMLNTDLWEMLKTQARRFHTKLFLLGDRCQLPPVKEDISKVFTDPDITYKYDLTQVERQAGDNPLMLIYDLIRNNLHKEHDQFQHVDNTSVMLRPDYIQGQDPRSPDVQTGHIFLNDLRQFGMNVVNAFKSEDFQHDPNYCKVLCWTNHQVEFWNASIRKTLITDLQRNPNTTQEILLHANILIPFELLMGYGTYSDGLQNSGEYKVIALQYDEKKIYWGDTKDKIAMIRGYRVSLLDIDQDTILNTFIVDPEPDNIITFTKVFNSYLFLAKTKKQWPAYFAFKGENLLMKEIRDAHGQLVCKKDLDYAYALTIHKSQGSTYDQVFIDLADVNKNKNHVERNKLKYVAFTRPRYLATIYTGGTS